MAVTLPKDVTFPDGQDPRVPSDLVDPSTGLPATLQPAFDPKPTQDIWDTVSSLFTATAKSGMLTGDGKPSVFPTFQEYLKKGFDQSTTGLLLNNKAPDVLKDPANLDLADRLAEQIGQVTGDTPSYLVGALAGGALGSLAGPVGTGAGAMGGGFALTQAMRQALVDGYQKGSIKSWDDYWTRAGHAALEAYRGLVTGVGTYAAGELAPAVPLAKPAAELLAMVTVGDAMRGQVPTAQEFIDGALVLGGMHVATGVSSKLMDIYAKTGVRPLQVLEDIKSQPQIKDELLSESPDLPTAYQIAYHGSPHDFTQFDVSRIGTGEGFQAYGYGLYFAENPSVAGAYKNTQPTKAMPLTPEVKDALKQLDNLGFDTRGEAMSNIYEHPDWVDRWDANPTNHPELASAVQTIEDFVKNNPRGNLYTVKLTPKPEEYLLWDKPLSEQPKAEAVFAKRFGMDTAGLDGRTALNRARNEVGDTKAVSRILNENGIKGVKYLDRGSRSNGQGTYNYVIFNPKDVQITHKNGEPVTAQEKTDFLNQPESRNLGGGSSDQPPTESPPPSEPPPEVPKGAVDRVKQRISFQGEKKPWYNIHDLARDVVSKLSPLKRLRNTLTQGQEVPVNQDFAKLAQMLPASANKAEHFLRYGTFDPNTMDIIGPSLQDIVTMSGKDLEDFSAYLASKHAIELHTKGQSVETVNPHGTGKTVPNPELYPAIETGIPHADAVQTVKDLGPKFEEKAKALYTYQDQLLNYGKELLGEDLIRKLRRQWKYYVPFNRDVQPEGGIGITRGMTAKPPIKRIKGSELPVINPLETIIKRTYQLINLADRNRVGLALMDMLEKNDPGQQFGKVIKKPNETPADPSVAVLKNELSTGIGKDVATAKDLELEQGPFVNGRDQITVYKNGEPIVLKLNPEVVNVFKGMDAESSNLLIKVLSYPAKWMRAGATNAISFITRNPTRDQFEAAINSDGFYVPFMGYARGLMDVANIHLGTGDKGALFKEWFRSGGPQSALMAMDRKYANISLRDLSGNKPFYLKTLNSINVLQGLQAVSTLNENATRLELYRVNKERALKQGMSSADAISEGGFASRTGTVDFMDMGAKVAALNHILPFTSANIGGWKVMLNTIKKHPYRTMLRAGAYITLPSVLLYAVNSKDPDFNEIPQWQKDLFWLVKMPFGLKEPGMVDALNPFTQNTSNGTWLRIPKPNIYGWVFGTGAERVMQWVLDKDPNAYNDLLSSFGRAAGSNWLITALQPIIESISNYNFFLDRPVIPADREKLLPAYQYSQYNTETMKALGKIIGNVPFLGNTRLASPAILENWIQDWTGNLGMSALQLADLALRKAGVVPDPVKPADNLADLFAWTGFTVRFPTMSADSITKFYDAYQLQDEYYQTWRTLLKEGNVDEGLKVMNKAVAEGQMMRLQGIRQALSNLSHYSRFVYQNPTFSEDEKRTMIDNTIYQMVNMAKLGNQIIADGVKSQKALLQRHAPLIKGSQSLPSDIVFPNSVGATKVP